MSSAALARLDAADPLAYARTRNALDGAVLRVSPYVTHGFVDVPAAIARIAARRPLRDGDRLVVEFAWREFFHHAWRHLGDAILADIRPPVWPGVYAQTVPDDVRRAATGVPAIDLAVRALYRDGWLHNHARMWVASYLVHLRKCHWRAGADWMFGHLLDGDLASNHLSWQWVAGTFSSKPYLFDAGNVERWAPSEWASCGTVVDCSYETLERIARGEGDQGLEDRRPAEVDEPPLCGEPPSSDAVVMAEAGWWPADTARLRADGARRLRLVHPWDLGGADDAGALPVAWLHPDFHARFPWSARRWRFVLDGLRARSAWLHVGDGSALIAAGFELETRATLNPGYCEASARFAARYPVPRHFADPDTFCPSFSKFWKRVGSKGCSQS